MAVPSGHLTVVLEIPKNGGSLKMYSGRVGGASGLPPPRPISKRAI